MCECVWEGGKRSSRHNNNQVNTTQKVYFDSNFEEKLATFTNKPVLCLARDNFSSRRDFFAEKTNLFKKNYKSFKKVI